MRMMALVAVLGLAACGPSEGDDTAVDAAGDALATGREFNVDCAPERYEVRQADGRVDVTTYWFAYVEQPFDWHTVKWRTCNPVPSVGSIECPAGATCTGTAPVVYPYCRSGQGIEQVSGGDDRGRVYCGVSTERTPAGGQTTTNGTYYRLAQIHID